MVRALYVILTTVIVMIAVPVSQLRTVSVRVEGCCPDPSKCHCPEEGQGVPGQVSIKACHKSSEFLTGASLPEFQPAPLASLPEPSRRIAFVQLPLPAPHAPPCPARPPAPS